jgi:hypothetical protein
MRAHHDEVARRFPGNADDFRTRIADDNAIFDCDGGTGLVNLA